MNISLQLYSVKDSAAQDYAATVARVARLGYAGVELDGWGNLPDQEMKELLKNNRLYAVGSHTQAHFFRNNLEEAMKWHAAVGAEYMIIPGGVDVSTVEAVAELCELLNSAAAVGEKYGIKVGYHNHAHEFCRINGEYALDMIAKNTSPNVVMEIDVYWVQYAGLDPYEYVESLGEKAELIHLKQIGPENENVALPDGYIDMERMIRSSRYARHFVVEQETFLPDLEAVWAIQKANIDHLNSLEL